MQNITNRYKLDNNILTNYNNVVYPKIIYSSELESDLTFNLQDAFLAKKIVNAYTKYIQPTLSENDEVLFCKALVRICYLFGSPQYPPRKGLCIALKEEGFAVDDWLQIHKKSFSHFMKEANQASFTKPSRAPEEVVHIVILTTSAAGGNLAVAKGVEKQLSHRYKVTLLDVEEEAEQVDPMMKATGIHTFDRIYAQVVQQENQMDEGFNLQLKTYREISRYIEPTLGRHLKEKIHSLHADFILSTRNGHQLDISLPYSLNIPGCIHHCDWEVGYFFRDLIGKMQPQLCKLWLPDNLTRVFQPIFLQKNLNWENSYSDKKWDEFKPIIAQALKTSTVELEQQVEFVGAPTRPEIFRIKDADKIERLRAKWGLQPEEQGVLVTMGKNGVGAMRDLFSKLLTSPAHTIPIRYLFICGTNQNMQHEFEEKLKNSDTSQTALQCNAVHGYVSGDEMNELLNINRLVIGKPGGSQVEECIKTRIPMLVAFSHDYWESGGQARLEREGYLVPYQAENSLTEQIEAYFATSSKEYIKKTASRKWKTLIPQAIERALSMPLIATQTS